MTEKMSERLKILAYFHIALGAIGCFFSLFPLIHVAVGVMIVNQGSVLSDMPADQGPPKEFGYLFIAMGSLFVIVGQAISIAIITSGVFMLKVKNRLFSLIIGGLECAIIPLGTVLGVFTLINLSDDQMKELYESQG